MLKSQIDPHHKIVFFDGICHLCNGFVNFAIQNGTSKTLLVFAPLQGTTAEQLLSPEDRKALSSVIFLNDGKTFRHSEAVLEIMKFLKFPWPLLAVIFQIIPSDFRNVIYNWVARNRYRWFGQRESCRLPEPQEKSQLWP
ncbi:MAG: thiol-disulfide oxidoreductase DCC family protein [Pseudobdellovibrionaceae bacterium]